MLQDKVSDNNRELETAGYGLLNLSATWQAIQRLQLAAGVANVLNNEFRDHMTGYTRVQNPDIALRDRLPGTGTNVFARLSYTFCSEVVKSCRDSTPITDSGSG